MKAKTAERLFLERLKEVGMAGFNAASLQKIAVFGAAAIFPKSPGIYLFGFIDVRRKPRFLYVGGTRSLYVKWKEHKKDLLQLKWHEIEKVDSVFICFKATKTREEAFAAEGDLIRSLVPPWNKNWGEIIRHA